MRDIAAALDAVLDEEHTRASNCSERLSRQNTFFLVLLCMYLFFYGSSVFNKHKQIASTKRRGSNRTRKEGKKEGRGGLRLLLIAFLPLWL